MRKLLFVVMMVMVGVLVACSGSSEDSATTAPPTATLTPVPSSTATSPATPTVQLSPTLPATFTPSATPLTIELVPGEGSPPPVELTLPQGWVVQHNLVPMQDIMGEIDNMRVSSYYGPVTGGTGFVILLWGFGNITSGSPLGDNSPNLWLDGLRLWRTLVVESECNISTDLQRNFEVGGLSAVGTFVAAVDCPNEPDTAGWFAGVQVDRVNFLFYAFTDPREAIQVQGGAPAELQAILDSADFVVNDWLTATPTLPPSRDD